MMQEMARARRTVESPPRMSDVSPESHQADRRRIRNCKGSKDIDSKDFSSARGKCHRSHAPTSSALCSISERRKDV